MNIQQEEILLKEFNTGTTVTFFSTHLNYLENTGLQYSPSIVWINDFNIPFNITTFDGQNLWALNSENNYVPIQSLTNNFITGYSYSQSVNYTVNEAIYNRIKTNFESNITNALNTGNTSSGEPIISGHTEYVFLKYNEIEDFYVNVKLNRTFGTLDTLNVYNNLTNSFPSQEASTGVVFGKLVALQNIKDAQGNSIRIPLKNVPVGIFNPSDEYPSPSSISDNGDRIFLNIKESSVQSEYFNIESFDLDKNKLLRSASQFTSVPPQYKYITTTNDEGEFVIYDAPVGTQIVMFEVDLLKQGLTRDEISLNFFPFPPNEDAILDQVPNFAFKQFPIDVVPAWGTLQTGYTELNVTVNMDLRKWTTYIFPPIANGPFNLETAVAQDASNIVKVEVRDMSKEGFPKTDIKITQIPNDLDKVLGQQYNWQLEFAQIKNKAEFFKFGCPIVKLPANIYDPNGFRTDSDGNPTTSRGVWLSAYQLKIYSNTEVDRKTGSIYAWNGSSMYTKSHFDLNFSSSVPDIRPQPEEGLGLGSFPYEKPWSTDYPEQYRIPRKPVSQRYQYEPDRTPTSTPGVYYIDEPAYNDGDLVGYEVPGPEVGGFGSQSSFGQWIGNRISQVATKNYMYKYESGVAWSEEYANGYQPSNPGYPRFAGVSKVVNGEKYQRFESGYGYFLKPSGWPRVYRTLWGADTHFGPDISFGNGLNGNPESPGPGVTNPQDSDGVHSYDTHINDVYNLNNINLALVMDENARIKHGTLEAYRIINSNPNNLNILSKFTIPTGVRLECGGTDERLLVFTLKNTGDIKIKFKNSLYGSVTISTGAIVAAGQFITLEPGQSYTTNSSGIIGFTGQNLPGNKDYNTITNRYEIASYELKFTVSNPTVYGNYLTVQFNKPALTSNPTWYMKTHHTGGPHGRISSGINTLFGGNASEDIAGVEIQNNNSSYDL